MESRFGLMAPGRKIREAGNTNLVMKEMVFLHFRLYPPHLHTTFTGGLVARIWLYHVHWALMGIRLCARHRGVPDAPNTSPPSGSMSCKRVGPGNAHLVFRVVKSTSGSMTYCEAFGKLFSPSGVSLVTRECWA